MKLRFEVDQAEAFRRGIDVPKSIVTVEANPADLSQEHRDLIADRLDGIDVRQLVGSRDGNGKLPRIMAELPTFESLMEAIVADEGFRTKMLNECDAAKSAQEKQHAAGKELLDEYLGRPSA